MDTKLLLSKSQRVVIKIGSALITRDGHGLDEEAVQSWTRQIAELTAKNKQCVLVSSGAVAEGMVRLGWKKRPHALHELQAAASVGQMGLVGCYEDRFKKHGLHTAQVLLSHDDLADRRRYLNARSTLTTLLDLKVIPIVNENDTVATEEIRFGDNDSLAAMVANLIEADLLILLTDRDGVFDSDPKINADAQLIEYAHVDDDRLLSAAGPSSGTLGRGGMITKVQAARTAARSGTHTVIMSGQVENGLLRLLAGEQLGTLLTASEGALSARKQWLAGRLIPKGVIVLDEGAVKVLKDKGRSLLPVGVTAVQGEFRRGDLVKCVDHNWQEIARGLINYSSVETIKIKGCSSKKIEQELGYIDEPELIHRDNLVVTA
ncbi:MAG: glutamate 5-kinase [Gammaproteobacteria bacterium]|nr:glutamate 5-kinase [Gammaproteobacteria bacterium]